MLLVSGGTGLVGSAVVAELLRRGEKVAVLGRDAARIRERFGDSVEPRAADVRDAATLTAAMQGVDVVVNAVQLPNSPIENKRKGWTFEEIDFKGTQRQVDAAKQAGVRRFVYVSGAGAAPDAPKHWFRFEWQAEQYVQSSGLEWVIVRPTWVYGPRDHSLNRIIGFGKFLPFIPTFGDGKQAMQPVFIDDVGRVLADCALRPEAANQLFELGGRETMTMDEVFQTALDVMGKKRPILHQPVVVGKAVGSIASLLPISNPPLSADAVDFITQPAVADTSHLKAVLNPQLTPLREALSTYMGKR
jgi:NADH dehydrogenase